MLPFYKERRAFIEREIAVMERKQEREGGLSKEDTAHLEFLQQQEVLNEASLTKERNEVQDMANEMFTTWKDIRELREK